MSADQLRRAAAKVREVAEDAATTGSWEWRSTDGAVYWPVETRAGRFIQAMSPAVALAVADLVSMIGDHAAGRGACCDSCIAKADEIARLLLGEDA